MKGQLPNFVIIGAQKSATRWLRDVLGEHPEIFTADRELEFFNHHYREGLAWYAERFASVAHERAVGEATPGYMMWTDDPQRIAARIDGVLPDARIISMLRDPMDRMVSAYIHHARMGRLDGSTSLMERVLSVDPEKDPMGLVSGGWYGRSLAPYAARFQDRLLVVLQEDAKSGPVELYDRVTEHLGVSAVWRPAALTETRHSNRSSVPDAVIRAARLTQADRRQLYDDFFRDDVLALTELFELDLDRWEPPARAEPVHSS